MAAATFPEEPPRVKAAKADHFQMKTVHLTFPFIRDSVRPELGREEVELVGQILLPGLGEEGESTVLDPEIETHSAAGGHTIEFFLT